MNRLNGCALIWH